MMSGGARCDRGEKEERGTRMFYLPEPPPQPESQNKGNYHANTLALVHFVGAYPITHDITLTTLFVASILVNSLIS